MSAQIFVPKLYGYWRSSASWRLRWAFELKQSSYQYIPVNILSGENKSPAHLARNSMGLLPLLEYAPGKFFAESLAIIQWLDETRESGKKLLPADPVLRSHCRALAELINAETAPLQTPRAQKKHSSDLDEQKEFAAFFIREGFKGFSAMCAPFRKKFCVGDEISLADLCLIPQMYNAGRFSISCETEFPDLWEIYKECLKTPECLISSPDRQIDALKS